MPLSEGEQATQIALVSNLYAMLARAADYGTLDEYGHLLDVDVVWEYPGEVGPSELVPQVRRGRADAIQGALERREAGIQGPDTGTWHVITNIAVVPGDGQAHATAYWHYYANVDKSATLRGTGVYRDRFVRTDDGWVLAHRKIVRG